MTDRTCSRDDCNEPHYGKGLCKKHYAAERIKNAPPCSTDDCDGKAFTRGMCVNCYARFRRNGTTDYPPPREVVECSAEGCTKAERLSLGLCPTHYSQDRLKKAPECSTEGCTGKAKCRGLCDNCHHRWLRNGTTDYQRPHVDAECADPACSRPAEVRGLCEPHYQKWWRAQPPSPKRRACSAEGCENVSTRLGLCDNHYRQQLLILKGDQIRATRAAWREANRDHVNAVFKDWEARNPEKVSLRDRRNKGRRRAAKQGESLDYELILAEFGMVCHICTGPIEWATLHMDHVIPLARGGTHTYDNVRPSHKSCNLRKGTKLMSEIGGRLDAPEPGLAV